MKTIKFKKYQTELINGNKGTINIPESEDLKYFLQTRQFIEDATTESFIRSSAIVKFEHIGYEERSIQ